MQLFAVPFRALDRWDAKAARVAAHRSAHPDFRPLGEFVEEVTELAAPWDEPDKEWPVYGVDNVNGVFFRHRQLGSKFRQKYKRIRKGWFFHNPTRSAVGSLGMVPDVPEDAITSPEYQVWRVTDGFLPEFMAIMIRTEAFKDLIRIHRVGAVKERLFVRNLQEITVPVPPNAAQQRISRSWLAAQPKVAASLASADQREREVERDLLTHLGVAFCERPSPGKVFSVSWSQCERWCVSFVRRHVAQSWDLGSAKYKVYSLGEIADVSYGIQKCPSNRPGQNARPYLRVANVQRGRLDLREIKWIDVPEDEFGSLCLRNGDLLVCEGNSADLVGRPAIWREEIADCVHQNHLLRVRLDPDVASPEFVLEYMQTPFARDYFRSRAKFTTNLASINSNDLRGLVVPIPPKKVQTRLLNQVAVARARIAKERDESSNLVQNIVNEIEALFVD